VYFLVKTILLITYGICVDKLSIENDYFDYLITLR